MWSQHFVVKLILEKNLKYIWKQYRILESNWVYNRINEELHKTHHAVKVEDILRENSSLSCSHLIIKKCLYQKTILPQKLS